MGCADGDVLDADRINCRRIDDLCAEVAKVHCFAVREAVYGVSRGYNTRVGCHKAVNICPYFQFVSSQFCGQYRGGVVRASPAEVGGHAGGGVACDEARYDSNAREAGQLVVDERGRGVEVDQTFPSFRRRLDEMPGVVADGARYERRDDKR